MRYGWTAWGGHPWRVCDGCGTEYSLDLPTCDDSNLVRLRECVAWSGACRGLVSPGLLATEHSMVGASADEFHLTCRNALRGVLG